MTRRRPAAPTYPLVRFEGSTLFRFVMLSMLLHAPVILLFGTTTGGGARRGARFWDPLEVTLRRLSPDPGSGIQACTRRRHARDRTPSAPTPARTEPPSGEPAPRLRIGTPNVDDEIFKPRRDVVTPPSKPGAQPRIDLDATRKRAREIASEGPDYRGLVPVVPTPPDRKSKTRSAEFKRMPKWNQGGMAAGAVSTQ